LAFDLVVRPPERAAVLLGMHASLVACASFTPFATLATPLASRLLGLFVGSYLLFSAGDGYADLAVTMSSASGAMAARICLTVSAGMPAPSSVLLRCIATRLK
jgi:hypothetical protein